MMTSIAAMPLNGCGMECHKSNANQNASQVSHASEFLTTLYAIIVICVSTMN